MSAPNQPLGSDDIRVAVDPTPRTASASPQGTHRNPQGGVSRRTGVRRGCPADVAAIYRLISLYASQGLLLPRTEEEVREHIARFLVLTKQRRVMACLALEPYGSGLAEVRSLAVDPESRGRGLGARLLEHALEEARKRKFTRVFAVTHMPDFFRRQGFAAASRRSLTEKIARDCCVCPKAAACELVAVTIDLSPDGLSLPILAATAEPAPCP